MVFPEPDAGHAAVAVKDPTFVRHNGLWHLFSTTVNTAGNWSMEYRSFATWADAVNTAPVYLDTNPHLTGYHCAPQVFFFKPHNKWYLIYQSQHPTYSTTDDISNPQSWTAPKSFFNGTPASVVEGWIDYWIICDTTHAYLFFSDDHGRFYRSRTTLANFPNGFDDPVVIMQEPNAFDLFEAACVYKIKEQNIYLCIIECLGKDGERYFKAFTADRLDGTWTPLSNGSTWAQPFLGSRNVVAADGGTVWSAGVSHGEFVRDGNDETMTLDPENLQFLYQGLPVGATASSYSQLPYRLALLTPGKPAAEKSTRFINLSTRAWCAEGDKVEVGGLVLSGDKPKRVLIRAVGPSLADFGVPADQVLADPLIEVHDTNRGNGVIASNDDHGAAPNPVAIRELSAQLGAFSLPSSDSKSAVLLTSLQPGTYTVVVSGRNGSSGIVLLEMYDAD